MLNQDDFSSTPPKSCQSSKWTMDQRLEGLDNLQSFAKLRCKLARTARIEQHGNAPNIPFLTNESLSADVNQARETCLHLKWGQTAGSSNVTFFVLETCGREGSRAHRRHEYRELYRDPPSAKNGHTSPRGELVIDSLG